MSVSGGGSPFGICGLFDAALHLAVGDGSGVGGRAGFGVKAGGFAAGAGGVVAAGAGVPVGVNVGVSVVPVVLVVPHFVAGVLGVALGPGGGTPSGAAAG